MNYSCCFSLLRTLYIVCRCSLNLNAECAQERSFLRLQKGPNTHIHTGNGEMNSTEASQKGEFTKVLYPKYKLIRIWKSRKFCARIKNTWPLLQTSNRMAWPFFATHGSAANSSSKLKWKVNKRLIRWIIEQRK